MDLHHSHTPSRVGMAHTETTRRVVVIADDGLAASVLILALPAGPAEGTHFQHQDRIWVITERRGRYRGYFAAPLEDA